MTNAFEAGKQKVIPAVLVYLFYQGKILMLHRGTDRPEDVHQGKWNGLGGKLEKNESAKAAAMREVYEEAGIQIRENQLKPIGTLHFPNFKARKNEDWWCVVYVAELASPLNQIPDFKSPEGTLQWISENEILNRPLWEGDLIFLPWVLSRRSFQGTFWYDEGKLVRHEIDTFAN